MIIRTYSLVPKVRREGAGDEATKPNDMTTTPLNQSLTV